jgi:shikimate dehydrogenase
MEKKIYGLLGEHLTHSYSPAIHAALGDYEYRLFEVAPSDLSAFLTEGDFAGINVTIPYKKSVIPYLSEISDAAKKIGSVNTVLRRSDGSLYGDNTDYYGFSHMLDRAKIDVAGKKCLILGSGGASLTAVAVVTDRGGTPVVISRTGENNYENIADHADADVIINTTPVGMYPNNGECPVDLSVFPHLSGVADVIYNPRRTALLQQAEGRGIPSAGGLTMLVAQAKRASELFFDTTRPDSLIDSVTAQMRNDMENIILVGMPGCGKSTVGRILANSTGKKFADTDEEIVRLSGRTPAEIIREDGEDAFRQIEHEAICRLGKLSGYVIATGGGVVTRTENYAPLHQNGILVFLRRPLEELSSAGRPLSQSVGVEALYEKRLPLYEAWADTRADTLENPRKTADAVLAAVKLTKENTGESI